jgi:hypothetical protein
MRLPNKVTTYKESVISFFPAILSILEKDALTPGELLNSMCTDDMDINDFISALDCLFAIGKVNYIEEGGLLGYVADKNQK